MVTPHCCSGIAEAGSAARSGVLPCATLHLAISLYLAAIPRATAEESPFTLDGNRLTTATDTLELSIQGGAVVGIRDRKTGEVFSDGEPWERLPQVLSGVSSTHDLYNFRTLWRWDPPRYARDPAIQGARRRPTQKGAPKLTKTGPLEATLECRDLSNGKDGDHLKYTVRVDPKTSEILVQAEARLADPKQPPVVLDVPLMNLKAQAVILGNGARYFEDESPEVDFCMRLSNNLYSPRMAVIEGKKGCLAAWPDSPFMIDNIYLAHRGKNNDVILHAGRDVRPRDPSTLKSVAWRIGAFANWVEAARRYRACFEERTGARPLWQQ